SLIGALNTDLDWLREHTRYLQRATEWDRGGRPSNRLLSGDDIAEAKAWAARRPKDAPEPTALHLDFIRGSEKESEAGSSAQRKQLEAMAAALKVAEEQKAIAEQEKAIAQNEKEQADRLLTSATNIIVRFQDQIDPDTMKEVFAVFQTGAHHGDANAMTNLGLVYRAGRGVTQDYAKAREWYEKAVEKGDTKAMVELGVLYQNGWGVSLDYAKAREWDEKAAAKGNADAMTSLAHRLSGLYFDALPVDYVKAREWYEKAAAKGNANAV